MPQFKAFQASASNLNEKTESAPMPQPIPIFENAGTGYRLYRRQWHDSDDPGPMSPRSQPKIETEEEKNSAWFITKNTSSTTNCYYARSDEVLPPTTAWICGKEGMHPPPIMST